MHCQLAECTHVQCSHVQNRHIQSSHVKSSHVQASYIQSSFHTPLCARLSCACCVHSVDSTSLPLSSTNHTSSDRRYGMLWSRFSSIFSAPSMKKTVSSSPYRIHLKESSPISFAAKNGATEALQLHYVSSFIVSAASLHQQLHHIGSFIT